MTTWRVRVVDRDGNRFGFIRTANVEKVYRGLNKLSWADWTFSAHDPTARLLLDRVDDDLDREPLGCLHRELQVMVDGVIVLWGPMPTFTVEPGGMVRGRIYSFAWWLFQRVVGRADRVNLLTNGSFEDTPDFDGWTTTGSPTIVSSPVADGTNAAELDSGEAVEQTFTFDHDYPLGLEPRFSVRIYFPTGNTAPPDDVWFEVEASDVAGVTRVDYDPDTIARDAFHEVTFGLGRTLPAGTAWDVTLRMIGGAGGNVFDNARAAQPESVGAPFGGATPQDVAVLLVEYMQDPAHGKDDLGINPFTSGSGGRTDLVWQDADHEEFGRALQQLVEMKDGVDWFTSESARNFYAAPSAWEHFPGLKLVAGRNLVDWEIEVDGSEARNSVIAIGSGPDFTRDEGAYKVDNGLPVMEKVIHMPKSTPLREYDLVAQEAAEQSAQPREFLRGTAVWAGDVMNMHISLYPGATLPAEVSVGYFRFERTVTVLSLTIDVAGDRVLAEVAG